MARILVPLAQGFEEIEAVTIIDILRRAAVEVIVAGLGAADITGAHDIAFRCDTTLDAVNPAGLDGVVLPGGMPGTTNLMQDTALRALVIDLDKQEKTVAALCAAPTVLAAAGILDGRRATCYPAFEKEMGNALYSSEPVVADGHVITSRGPGTAMAFALSLVRALCGDEKADTLANALLHKERP